PARQRTLRHRAGRRLEGAGAAAQGNRQHGAGRRQAADAGRALRHEDRGAGGRAEGAGDDAASRRRGRAQPQGQPARSSIVDPQDQRLGDPAGHLGIAAGGDRPVRAAGSIPPHRERPLERAGDRPGLRGAARAAILQLAQDLDLRRLERDPEEHHREGDIGVVVAFPGRGAPRSGAPQIRGPGLQPGSRVCNASLRAALRPGHVCCASEINMDFELSDEQRLLKDSVERLTTQRYDFEARKKYMAEPDGWSRALWKQYVDLGLTALPFAEEHGGIGGGPVETMIVMEAFGRALALEPFWASVVLGGSFLARGASKAAQTDLLPKVAAGESLLAFAHIERQARYDLADVATTAKKDGAGFVLDGA